MDSREDCLPSFPSSLSGALVVLASLGDLVTPWAPAGSHVPVPGGHTGSTHSHASSSLTATSSMWVLV